MPTIEKLIVHNLNLSGQSPIYSEGLIDLTTLEHQEQALGFFKEHIQNNRLQSQTKICKFNETNANHVKNSIIELSRQEESTNLNEEFDELFKEKSMLIADHLANSMRPRSSSDGSIFVFIYIYEGVRHLGLLKMDPNLGIQVNENLTLTVRPAMLPSTKEKLHKSAFIKLKSEFGENESHLYVLDRQQTQDEPAKYFLHDFLQAREKANNSNLTKIIEREIKSEISLRIDSPSQISEFNSKLKTSLIHSQLFNLDEDLPILIRDVLPEGYAVDQSLRTIKEKVIAKYPDATFAFRPRREEVKDLIYKSENQNVTIRIHSTVEEDLFEYRVDEQTGQTIFTFSPNLNVIPKS